MLSDNATVTLKVFDCSLFTRKILVAEPKHQYLQWNLEREPAHYNYIETIARTFFIPSCENQFILEQIFKKAPIRRIAVTLNKNSAIAGSFTENPFNYQRFHLRELRIIRGGRGGNCFTRYNFSCRPYVTAMKAMQFNEDFPDPIIEVFLKIIIFMFLT